MQYSIRSVKLSVVCAVVLGLACSASSAVAATNIVTNGSFEANNIGNVPWTYLSSVTGWTSTGEFEIQKGSNAGGWGSFNTADAGNQYLELNSTKLTTVSQVLNTSKGTTYELSFDFSGRSDTPGGAPSKMAIYWNGVDIGTVSAKPNSGWIDLSFDNLIATAGKTTLSFKSLGPTSAPSYGSYLDDVVVTAVPSVPEPASMAMLLGGLGMLAFTIHRRKQG